MRAKVQIENTNRYNKPVKRKISKIVKLLFENDVIAKNSAVAPYNPKNIFFDIVFVNNEEIKKINYQYRKINAPTDVITFALFADDENKFIFDETINLGEIIISVEKAKMQALNGLDNEILTLICHGILHLLGFDHKTDKDYNFIVSIQEDIISKL